MKTKILYSLVIFSIVASLFVSIPKVAAASETFYVANSTCNVRTGPGTNYSILTTDGENIQVRSNQELTYINTKTGTVNGTNDNWYGIKLDYAAKEYTGYVWSSCVDTYTKTYNDDSSFESEISSFPDSYKPYLRRLHALHSNWKFYADYNNLNWSDAVNSESAIGQSAVQGYPSLYFIDSNYPSGIVVDGTSWYAPCADAVGYYLDARNFLTERNIFMFEKLSYDSIQDSAVQLMLNGTFMSGSFTENGVTKTYADAFIEAAKKTGVSATHLASRVIQEVVESNGGKSAAVTGTVAGYEGYYNFYNIGAYSGTDNYLKGLQYAKDHGWNSIQGAITGGASIIGANYISRGQNTIYFEKYDVSSYRATAAYSHEYMTNIMAPKSESQTVFNSYTSAGTINNSYAFVIPVYNNMPATAFKLSRTDTIGGTTNNGGSTTVSPSTKVSNAGYNLSTGYLTGISYQTDMSTIRSKLTNAGASVGSTDSNWNSKTSGIVATGDKIGVDDKVYEAVIYGDVASDGSISIRDLLYIQKYLLGDLNLSGANKEAADISREGGITIKDLLLMQKYLLGEYTINQ